MNRIIKLTNRFYLPKLMSLFLLIGCLQSCNRDDISGDVAPVAENRAQTKKGESLGPVITKKIGKEGGTIELPSQGISLTIPAGAIQEDTTFGIETITNTNPASVGAAYRLTPAGITLSKPATISFSMQKMKDEISVPEALAVSYQTEEGYWNMLDSKQTKDINGQLTAITTHLGDIGPMQWLFLKPVKASVFVNKSIELQAIRYIPVPVDPDDYLVVPLVPKKEGEETPVLDPVSLDAKYIKKWELAGPGTLTPNGNKAQYQAYSSILGGNSAAVSVELKTKTQKVMLVSNLEIVTDEYLKLKINDGPTINLVGVASFASNDKTVFGIAGALPDDFNNIPFVLNGRSSKGSYPWDDSNIGGNNDTDAQFQYTQSSGAYYVDWFEPNNGDPYEASPGGLQVLEFGTYGEYVIGKFTASSAGHYNAAHKYIGTGKVEGEFKLLLSNVGGKGSNGKISLQNKLIQSLERQKSK